MVHSVEEQEINTFTKWINSHLKKRDMEINDIFTDLRDGLALINLYEIISGKKVPKYNKKPKLEVQMIENLEIFLGPIREFLKELGIGVQYGSQQIYAAQEHSEKLQILGLIFVLISKFVIADGESDNYKQLKNELLQWCQDNTADYDNVNIKNFTTSWSSGLGFNALLDNFGFCATDYSKLDGEDALGNLQLATATAEKLGIPNLIDEEALASKENISERSQITYLALYRKYMKGLGDKKKEQALQKSIASFNFSAGQLLESLQKKIDELNNTDVSESSNTETLETLAAFDDYRNGEKATFARKAAALQVEFMNLQAERAKAKVDPFVPEEGEPSLDGVSQKLAELRKAESDLYQRATDRSRSFDSVAQDFDKASSEYVQWAEGQISGGEPDADESQNKFDNLVALYKEMDADGLSLRSNADLGQLTSLNDCIQFAVNGTVSEDLQAILDETAEEKQQFDQEYQGEDLKVDAKEEDINLD